MKLSKNTVVHTTFDSYTLIEQIGSGGNGKVFSAKASNNEFVAIKFIEKNISTEKLKRFKNEINFCERHHHKNIVRVLDHGRVLLGDKEFLFYVMPIYFETLRDKIKKGIPPEKILQVFVGLIEGIKFAHDNECIHRDIKPENIMFTEESYEPIICDFGIAHFSEENLYTIVETKATSRMANFQYAAPEQRKKPSEYYPQTDIYSLALILNEMFTGEIPQAAGYKKIKDIHKEYDFLDKVFEQLFIQDPFKRLFPESRILSEIKTRELYQKKEEDRKNLQSNIIQLPEVQEVNATIVDISCQDGELIFYYNMNLPDDWVHTIKYGHYSCSFMLSYDKHLLKCVGRNGLSMRLLGSESADTIKHIVKNVTEWTKAVNNMYNTLLKQNAAREQRELEQKRLEEIEHLEKEIATNNIAKAALAELGF